MSQSLPRFDPAPGYARVKIVHSFDELAKTRFADGVNALCWQRQLEGDFAEVVRHLTLDDDIVALDDATLRALPLSAAGQQAVDTLIEDQRRLRELGLVPVLECIRKYSRDVDDAAVPTDVYSFHADSATVETDTYLCSYTEASSEGLRQDEARRCTDIPETRAALLATFGGKDDNEFAAYLSENCYDLHYVERPTSQPFSFGLGHLWRIAVDYPGCPVPPCVHRAPDTVPGRPPRLLLIS
ncbi:MAG: hypothetical protein ABIZ04_19480 [Opitutus sp.]